MKNRKLIVLSEPWNQFIFGGPACQNCNPITINLLNNSLLNSLTGAFERFSFNFGNTFLKET